LITAAVFHVLTNLVPNRAVGRRNDGTQLLGLAGRSKRAAMRAIRIAEREVPRASGLEGTRRDPERLLEVLGRACAQPWLDTKARENLQAERGAALWLAGRFLESAQAFENLKHRRDGWADSLCTAALFGQVERDDPRIASAAEAIEQRARNDRSIAAAHTLAVLRLVQGRSAGAWLALSTYAPNDLAPAYRAAVVATQALAAPDSARRTQLFQEAREIDPSSVWTSLENASPIQEPAPEMTTLQTTD
jgi:hypothetical protein